MRVTGSDLWPFGKRRASPSEIRLLCLIPHYFGSGSFRGGSTHTEREVRRECVQRTINSLKDLPYRVTVQVCGQEGASTLPLDVQFPPDMDPTHIVYETIEEAARRSGDYDYVMVVEDDVVVPQETVARMIRFNDASEINEVLLPNRMESAGSHFVCIDLLAMPGWRKLNRQFEGDDLDCAINGHSGFALLSRQQWEFARQRVRFGRRERWWGGPMASAFANLHLPFLLWRTTALDRHTVVHSDPTLSTIPPVNVRATRVAREPNDARAGLDGLTFDRGICSIRGWAADLEGSAVQKPSIKVGSVSLPVIAVKRVPRPDVQVRYPDVELATGFVASVDLAAAGSLAVDADTLMVAIGDTTLTARWPRANAVFSVHNAPVIPDSPFMPSAAIDRLRELMAASQTYLEYGTGGSTLLAAATGIPQMFCVESDQAWLAAVMRKVGEDFPDGSSEVTPLYVDIGPTGDWGKPLSIPPGTSAGDYSTSVWRTMDERGLTPDLVLIDGRYRVACFLASVLHAKPGTVVLLDDYLDREKYSVVAQIVEPRAYHARVAEFVVPQELDRANAWELLVRYAGDLS